MSCDELFRGGRPSETLSAGLADVWASRSGLLVILVAAVKKSLEVFKIAGISNLPTTTGRDASQNLHNKDFIGKILRRWDLWADLVRKAYLPILLRLNPLPGQ